MKILKPFCENNQKCHQTHAQVVENLSSFADLTKSQTSKIRNPDADQGKAKHYKIGISIEIGYKAYNIC